MTMPQEALYALDRAATFIRDVAAGRVKGLPKEVKPSFLSKL